MVESLTALVILVMMLTGGMAFYYQANSLYYSGLFRRIATSLAASQLEVCKNEGYAKLLITTETVCRQTGAAVAVGQLSGSTRTVTVTDGPGSNLKEVDVTVNWLDPSKGAQAVTLQTYVGL